MARSGTLTPKQSKAIAALLVAKDAREAGLLAGVPERTMRRWMQLEIFREALAAEEVRLVKQAARQLTAATAEAIETMQGMMRDPGAPPGVRLRAADLLLQRSREYREGIVFEERLQRLEDMIGDRAE